MVLLVSPHNVVKKDYYVSDFEVDKINGLDEKHVTIYSQGVNISLCLKTLQTEPFLVTFFGGVNGKHVKNHLHVHKIKNDNIHVAKNSYEKINIIDHNRNTHTVIRDAYMQIDEKIALAYSNLVKEHLKRCSLVIFEDRTRKYFNNNILLNMFKEASSHNVRSVLDIKSEVQLSEISTFKPFAVKFNKKALDANKIDFNDFEALKKYCYEIIDKGIHYVLIDLHDDGVYLFSKKHYTFATPKNPVLNNKYYAEGTDALLAGFATGISKDYEEEKMLKIALASELAVYEYGPIEGLNRKNIFDLKNKTKISMHTLNDDELID